MGEIQSSKFISVTFFFIILLFLTITLIFFFISDRIFKLNLDDTYQRIVSDSQCREMLDWH